MKIANFRLNNYFHFSIALIKALRLGTLIMMLELYEFSLIVVSSYLLHNHSPKTSDFIVNFRPTNRNSFVSVMIFNQIPLIDERIGNLVIVTSNPNFNEQIKSQLTIIVRGMYSNPPAHGARIVSEILNDQKLYAEW